MVKVKTMFCVSVVLSDGAHYTSAALLPAHLEALGVLPLSGNHDCYICRGPLRLRGDGGELFLHP